MKSVITENSLEIHRALLSVPLGSGDSCGSAPSAPLLFFVTADSLFPRQLQQQQAELEVHQRDGLSSYDLPQVNFWKTLSQLELSPTEGLRTKSNP